MEPGLSDQDDVVLGSGDEAIEFRPQWSLVFPTRMTHEAVTSTRKRCSPQWSLVFPTRMTQALGQAETRHQAAMEPGLSDQDDSPAAR